MKTSFIDLLDVVFEALSGFAKRISCWFAELHPKVRMALLTAIGLLGMGFSTAIGLDGFNAGRLLYQQDHLFYAVVLYGIGTLLLMPFTVFVVGSLIALFRTKERNPMNPYAPPIQYKAGTY